MARDHCCFMKLPQGSAHSPKCPKTRSSLGRFSLKNTPSSIVYATLITVAASKHCHRIGSNIFCQEYWIKRQQIQAVCVVVNYMQFKIGVFLEIPWILHGIRYLIIINMAVFWNNTPCSPVNFLPKPFSSIFH